MFIQDIMTWLVNLLTANLACEICLHVECAPLPHSLLWTI